MQFDKIIGYDWMLDKFFPIAMTGEYLCSLASPGVTLESLDSVSSSLDALTTSLDDFSVATLAQLSIVNTAHKLGFFTGSNLEATLVSAEQSGNGSRFFVRGFRPITDAATCYGTVSGRESQQATATYNSETLINTQGFIPQRLSTRYARGKLRIPAGTTWTYATGIEPDVVNDGQK